MKLLIDESLPPRLAQRLADLFADMQHVRDFELKGNGCGNLAFRAQ